MPMQIRRGVVAIIYDIKSNDNFDNSNRSVKSDKSNTSNFNNVQQGRPYFLILHRSFVWNGWEFPKGGISDKEEPSNAVIQKIYESTKLKNVTIVKKLEQKREFLHKGKFYSYNVFIIKADMKEKIDISDEVTEHDDFAWLSYPEVLEKLFWDNEKRAVTAFVNSLKK